MANKVDESFLKEFIKSIQKNPKLREELLNSLDLGRFVYRDEFNELLKEIKQLRIDSNQRFETIVNLMEKRFEAVDKRFEAADRRFTELLEEMNKRFEAIDKRFEAVDKRFEAADRRFTELLEEMNKRFEAIDKRFEAVDKRFEAVDKRFEAIDRRFEELIATMAKGFTEMKDYIDIRFNEVTGRFGHRVESALRKMARELLKEKGYDPNKIEYIKVRDNKGKFFGRANYIADVDIYYHNGETWVVEVKSRPEESVLIKMILLKKLLETDYKMEINRLILIALSVSEEVKEKADELGIEIWHTMKERPSFIEPKITTD
ncbi:MAG: DUF3782 domain-containing protein [Candidatus Hodarchaeales archaeon]